MSLKKLPDLTDDVLREIFDFLPVKDRFRTRRVCKRLYYLSVTSLRSFNISDFALKPCRREHVFATIYRRLAGQLTEVHWPRFMGTQGLWPWLPFILPKWCPNLTTFDAPLLDFRSPSWGKFNNRFYETVLDLTVKSVNVSTLRRFVQLKSVIVEDVLECDWPVGPDEPGFCDNQEVQQFGHAIYALLARFPDLRVWAADIVKLTAAVPFRTNLPPIRSCKWGNDRNLNRKELEKFAQMCPSLKDLSVASIPTARFDELKPWAESLVTLRLYKITNASAGRLITFDQAVGNLANLRNLYIYSCNVVGDFKFLNSLNQLRVLDIRMDARPHFPIFFDLSPKCPLKRLSIRRPDHCVRRFKTSDWVGQSSVMTAHWQSTLERLRFDLDSYVQWPSNQGALLQLLEKCSAIKWFRLTCSYPCVDTQSLELPVQHLAALSLKPTVETMGLFIIDSLPVCHGVGFSIPISTPSPYILGPCGSHGDHKGDPHGNPHGIPVRIPL